MVDFNFNTSETKSTLNFVPLNNVDFKFSVLSEDEPEVAYDFYFGVNVFNYEIFRGSSNVFNAIWCDPKASLTSGRFYVTRENDLTVINSNNGQAITELYHELTKINMSGDLDNYVDLNVK